MKIEQDNTMYNMIYDNLTRKINEQYEHFKKSKEKRVKLSLFNKDSGGGDSCKCSRGDQKGVLESL